MVASASILRSRTAPRLGRIAATVATGSVIVVCAVILVEELAAMNGNRHVWGLLAGDYRIYMEATERWLAGGSFYPPSELAGPYEVWWGAVLYPPQMLALFVPFTVLPWPLWWAIPIGITTGLILSWRPAPWAWAAMLLITVLYVWRFLIFWAGTPTIWFVAFVALGLRYAPWAALIFLKPTIAPFALIGARDRRWWLVSIAVAVSCLACWPLFSEWLAVIRNLRGSDALYSLGDFAPLSLPLIAWLGRSDRVGVGLRGLGADHTA